jgi:hypothetical protein
LNKNFQLDRMTAAETFRKWFIEKKNKVGVLIDGELRTFERKETCYQINNAKFYQEEGKWKFDCMRGYFFSEEEAPLPFLIPSRRWVEHDDYDDPNDQITGYTYVDIEAYNKHIIFCLSFFKRGKKMLGKTKKRITYLFHILPLPSICLFTILSYMRMIDLYGEENMIHYILASDLEIPGIIC